MDLKAGAITHSQLAAGERRIRWGTPLFFVGWTALVILMVWWLGAAGTERPDLLIALDRTDATTWSGKARRWVDHVEIYWAYAWIFLAPYVVWLSLRFALEKAGLTWRLALHLGLGAGFILASQALTHRLASLRPKAIFIRKGEVVRQVTQNGTNEPATVVITRTTEWHGDPETSLHDGPLLEPRPGPLPQRRTERFSTGSAEEDRVIVIRPELGPGATSTSISTTNFFDAPLTNVTARDLAHRLAPFIEEQLKDAPGPRQFPAPRRTGAALDALAYLALIGLAQAIHFRRRLGERETQAASLEAKLTQARLHALQAQLQPHFLFNALYGIATLVRRDPRTAEEMLASLSDLLRASLSQSGRQEIPLREELEILDRYLELQQMRFSDRLRVERRVSPEALDCLVPSLLFQPLVENAIRHGLEPSPNPGLVRIIAERAGEQVVLGVEDNGVGLGGPQNLFSSPGNGLGLSSIRERLTGLYGGGHEFTFLEKPEGGVIVQIKIPARLATKERSELKTPAEE